MTKETTISLREIDESGAEFSWTQRDPWFATLLDKEFASYRRQGAAATFGVYVRREGSHYRLEGSLQMALEPICGRCGKTFSKDLRHRFSLLLIPPSSLGRIPKAKGIKDAKEAGGHRSRGGRSDREWGASDDDMVREDVLASILSDPDRVDVAPYFQEQAFLCLPMTFRCRPDCPGLCPHCGAELSEAPCHCKRDIQDPRWRALENFKAK